MPARNDGRYASPWRSPLSYFIKVINNNVEKCPQQCVAPTEEYNRCRYKITDKDVQFAKHAEELSKECESEDERRECLRQGVLARCCSQWHRDKLLAEEQEHKNKTRSYLYHIARRYEKLLLASTGAQDEDDTPSTPRQPKRTVGRLEVPQTPRKNPRTNATEPGSSPASPSAQASFRNVQRLRKDSRLLETDPGIATSIFIRYEDPQAPSVLNILRSRIPTAYIKRGEIYAYDSPSHPGFVKIGYTYNVGRRMRKWTECFPDARERVILSDVNYPQRIEELIHAELRLLRRKIAICQTCDKTHCEWFEMPINVANETMENWAGLFEKDPLYSAERHLSPTWSRRIDPLDEHITARALHELVDNENLIAQASAMHPSGLSMRVQPEGDVDAETVYGSLDTPTLLQAECGGFEAEAVA